MMLIISQIITQLLTSTMSLIPLSNCQQEREKWPFLTTVYFFFPISKARGGRLLLVNGVLQVLLQPLGLGVDAHFSVVLQLGAAEAKEKTRDQKGLLFTHTFTPDSVYAYYLYGSTLDMK